jgi:hypothetical protein
MLVFTADRCCVIGCVVLDDSRDENIGNPSFDMASHPRRTSSSKQVTFFFNSTMPAMCIVLHTLNFQFETVCCVTHSVTLFLK